MRAETMGVCWLLGYGKLGVVGPTRQTLPDHAFEERATMKRVPEEASTPSLRASCMQSARVCSPLTSSVLARNIYPAAISVTVLLTPAHSSFPRSHSPVLARLAPRPLLPNPALPNSRVNNTHTCLQSNSSASGNLDDAGVHLSPAIFSRHVNTA